MADTPWNLLDGAEVDMAAGPDNLKMTTPEPDSPLTTFGQGVPEWAPAGEEVASDEGGGGDIFAPLTPPLLTGEALDIDLAPVPLRTKARQVKPGIAKKEPRRGGAAGVRATHRCNACGYTSERRGNVRRHFTARHTKDKPFSCAFCPCESCNTPPCCVSPIGENRGLCVDRGADASADSGAVTRHERQHTGARPAKCDFPGCTYAAPDYSNPGRHLRTHTQVRAPGSSVSVARC